MSDPAKTVYSCPDCDRPILNRKFNKCLYCGATIPGELLFTDIEIREKEEKYKKQMEENEKKRRNYRNSISGEYLHSSEWANFVDIANFGDGE